jgi:hypothetical protein
MDILETLLIVAAIAAGLAVYMLLVELQKKMLTRGAKADKSPLPNQILKGYLRVFVSADNFFVTAIALFLIAFVIFMRHGQFLLDFF